MRDSLVASGADLDHRAKLRLTAREFWRESGSESRRGKEKADSRSHISQGWRTMRRRGSKAVEITV